MASTETSATGRSLNSVAEPREGDEASGAPVYQGQARGVAPSGQAVDDEEVGGSVPSSVIHELRTPLTAIHGYAQVLQRALQSDPSKSRAANVLLSESTRLTALLNQLSELAEIDSASPDDALVPTDVRQLVDGIVERRARRSPNHTFAVEGTGTVRTDARRLGQALSHLIDNAVAYSPDGGEVRVRIEGRPDGVHAEVSDEGIGIPLEEGNRIFQRYRRGSNARRAGVRGLGIGLYVARRAILREGGRIWHAPADRQGTIFHVIVPNA